MTRPISMLKKWIAPLHVCDFTEKLLHYPAAAFLFENSLVDQVLNVAEGGIRRSSGEGGEAACGEFICKGAAEQRREQFLLTIGEARIRMPRPEARGAEVARDLPFALF